MFCTIHNLRVTIFIMDSPVDNLQTAQGYEGNDSVVAGTNWFADVSSFNNNGSPSAVAQQVQGALGGQINP